YDPIAEDRQLTLRVAAAGNATVYCDRDLFFEAVANLVDNAVKFTPSDGCIDISLVRGEDENIIRVSDTGPGIAEGERDAVMRRFYRSDKSRNSFGVGLGLSLVSAIVKLHGFRQKRSDRYERPCNFRRAIETANRHPGACKPPVFTDLRQARSELSRRY